MNQETEKALRESIEHWRRMAGDNPNKEAPQSNQCALCSKFCFNNPGGACVGCPVYDKTGEWLCEGTPFANAYNAFLDYSADSDEFRATAKLELEFLESLLPTNLKD